jgi:energy-coupling factor transporter ATP-binding protein EcfA2
MAANQGFPRILLERSAPERRRYFQDYTIAHPHLADVYQQLRDELATVAPGSLIFVCGPSGIGKTTLLRRIEQKLLKEMKPELEQDPCRLPLVMIEALSPETGNFNWKDFYRRLLIKLDEPCIDKKVVPGLWRNEIEDSRYVGIHRKAGVAEFRHAVEQALKYRRPVAVCIDEAQHLARMASGRKLQDQLDCIKSLANLTGVPIVLCGHYELLVFRNLSAQLSRRSIDIHFRRYRADEKSELRIFKNVIWSFERHLPLGEEPDLVEQWDYLYERSLGCVGVLKLWLVKGLSAALKDGGRKLTLQHLNKTAPSVIRCEKMLSDLREGEDMLAEPLEARHQLRLQLGLEPAPNRSIAEVGEKSKATVAKPKRHPGQRHPTRDTVGTG